MIKIKKVNVQTKTRQIDANWKFLLEEYKEIQHHFGEELRAEIDKEILAEVRGKQLEMEGWTKIPITVWRKDNMELWFEQNIMDECFISHRYVWFKNAQDATVFALRWSE